VAPELRGGLAEFFEIMKYGNTEIKNRRIQERNLKRVLSVRVWQRRLGDGLEAVRGGLRAASRTVSYRISLRILPLKTVSSRLNRRKWLISRI